MIEDKMKKHLGENWKDYFSLQDYEELLDDLVDYQDHEVEPSSNLYL